MINSSLYIHLYPPVLFRFPLHTSVIFELCISNSVSTSTILSHSFTYLPSNVNWITGFLFFLSAFIFDLLNPSLAL
ncbi:hypothetical protein CVD19_00920 [Bacillus sp. T33-2]|nr:hypothetical protein CVD19_00920 [Bacillus sp. T33-2]